LFVNTALYQLTQLRLPVALPLDVIFLVIFAAGEASILKIYLQDKFPMGNLVNFDRNGILIVLDDEAWPYVTFVYARNFIN